MWLIRSLIVTGVLGMVLMSSASLQAQKGKPSPSSDYPGTLTFSCTSTDFVSVSCANGDQVVGDDRNYPGSGAAETGQGAFLRDSNKELWLGFGEGFYKMLLDFSGGPVDWPTPCSLNGNCILPGLAEKTFLIDSEDGEIQSNAVTELGTELSNGLMGLGLGQSGHSRLMINFGDPLGSGALWTVRFNGLEYAGSDEIPVTRLDACTWVFESDGDDDDGDGVVEPLAGLRAGSKVGRKRFSTDEGLFVLRFTMTLRVPGLCS